jgi:flagellar biogenesis protein FliO
MELSQQLAVIGSVFALLALCLFLARRRGLIRVQLPSLRSRPEREFELLDRIALGPQHALHLIRWGEDRLLIATHPRGTDVIEPMAAQTHSTSLSNPASGQWGGRH